MLLTSNHICSNNLPLWQSVTKTTTNKWTYEKFHKSLNPYTLVEYSNIYYPNTNIWKTLQEESLWQEDFDNLYFWNTLIKTHQSILVWNRNNRLHTINMKHVYKGRKETTHGEIGEITHINIYIYIYLYKPNISTIYVKWPQDQYTREIMYLKNRKKRKRYINSSLHPSIYTPNKNLLY